MWTLLLASTVSLPYRHWRVTGTSAVSISPSADVLIHVVAIDSIVAGTSAVPNADALMFASALMPELHLKGLLLGSS